MGAGELQNFKTYNHVRKGKGTSRLKRQEIENGKQQNDRKLFGGLTACLLYTILQCVPKYMFQKNAIVVKPIETKTDGAKKVIVQINNVLMF